jgi:hypothetical protein
MKLVIYLALFIFILYYLDNVSENFSDKYHSFEIKNEVNQYDVLDTDKIRSILEYKNLDNVKPDDTKEMDIYKNISWEVKPIMFDIFNNDPPINKQEEIEESNSDQKSVQKSKNLMELIQLVKIDNMIYKLLGAAYNEYFNQYFLIYEIPMKENSVKLQNSNNDVFNNYMNEKDSMEKYQNLYGYFLGKVNNKTKEVEPIHKFGPRTKIEINDVIYLALGTFQLGPLTIKKI